MLMLYYPKCSTCVKAKKWLEEQGIACTLRDIQKEPPTREELAQWYEKSGLPLKKFFNTSGQVYRSMELKDKLPKMGDEEQLTLLSTNGMLVKRPIVINGDTVLVGFKEADWKGALL